MMMKRILKITFLSHCLALLGSTRSAIAGEFSLNSFKSRWAPNVDLLRDCVKANILLKWSMDLSSVCLLPVIMIKAEMGAKCLNELKNHWVLFQKHKLQKFPDFFFFFFSFFPNLQKNEVICFREKKTAISWNRGVVWIAPLKGKNWKQ